MGRRKKTLAPLPRESKFSTEPTFELNGFIINAGDLVKVHGEHGGKFKVVGLTTNLQTNVSWVDCFEVIGGIPSVFRSFRLERLKRIPQRGKRAKRVSN